MITIMPTKVWSPLPMESHNRELTDLNISTL